MIRLPGGDFVQVGDTVHLGPACGAQFRAVPLTVTVTGFRGYTTTPGHMTYLSGYAQRDGRAEFRPELLVVVAGIRIVSKRKHPPRPRNTRSAGVPKPRSSSTFRSHR